MFIAISYFHRDGASESRQTLLTCDDSSLRLRVDSVLGYDSSCEEKNPDDGPQQYDCIVKCDEKLIQK